MHMYHVDVGDDDDGDDDDGDAVDHDDYHYY